jgi:hypothetical protein
MHEYVAHLRQGNGRSLGTILPLVGRFASSGLTWWPQLGIGYYPVATGLEPYDQDYFDRFARDAQSELGRALMRARCNFVEQHYRGPLIDVGIGCGAFVELRNSRGRMTYGYDVNPAGIKWLLARKLMINPYRITFDAITLWDVLEHISDFQGLLNNVASWVFVSMPIFYSVEHALCSKHFRTDEHYWYFTRDGLIHAMRVCGFELISASNIETELGREDIGTFAFRRDANVA